MLLSALLLASLATFSLAAPPTTKPLGRGDDDVRDAKGPTVAAAVHPSAVPSPQLMDAIHRYAPSIYLDVNEQFNPSDVGYFLRNTFVSSHGQKVQQPDTLNEMNLASVPLKDSNDLRLTTKEPLGCDDCSNPKFLRGFDPTRVSVPVYVIVVEKPQIQSIDAYYFTFYPFNGGKEACVGLRVFGKCIGKTMEFGNHVGDWEHVAIRFNQQSLTPTQYFGSEHTSGFTYNLNDKALTLVEGTHVTFYSARGSHGLRAVAGDYMYQKLANGDKLTDNFSKGKPWDSWKNLKITYKKDVYDGEFTWMNFLGDWGNGKSGCFLNKIGIDECQTEDGPSGPGQRGWLGDKTLQ